MAVFSISFLVSPNIESVEKQVIDTENLVDAVKRAKQLIHNSNIAHSNEVLPEGFAVFDSSSREVFNSFEQS